MAERGPERRWGGVVGGGRAEYVCINVLVCGEGEGPKAQLERYSQTGWDAGQATLNSPAGFIYQRWSGPVRGQGSPVGPPVPEA